MSTPLLERDPRQLGGYWLAARLGAGGQGVVYEGYDVQGTRVAVKALHTDAVDEAFRDGLRKEAAALQRVAPFCTARILAADLDHAPPYIVSEYVPGADLQSWVDRTGAYRPDELHRLAIGVVTALASIHRAGVVHRDLKPANVLLGPDGPRVIDFGIARTEEMSRSATGSIKGTPRWMAPEVFRGHRPTPAVDVWAWGAIVLFAATGKAPFDGDTLPVLMHQITTLRPDTGVLAEPLRGLVEAALRQDPDERPRPEDVLAGLIGGRRPDPLEAGKQAAAGTVQPSMTFPPTLGALAERAYGGLDPQARQAVPRILLRMLAARARAGDVLCTVPVGDFSDGDADPGTVHRVLTAFGDAGLLHGSGGTVRLTTPALLRAWPRLREWFEAERDGLDHHHVLADATHRWDGGGRKPTDLLQGSRLDDALGWASAGRRHITLNPAERDFLKASVEQTRRRARTRTAVTGALAALLLVALLAGGTAGAQSWNLAKANDTVSAQRDSAVGRQLAARALQLRRTDPTLARRLAVAAASLAGDVPDAHDALLALNSQWERDIWAPPGTDGSWNQVYPAGGGPTVFWKPATGRIIIADAGARRVVRTLAVTGAPLAGMDLTLDGARLFTLQKDGTQVFWDVATGAARPLPYKHPAGAGLWLSPTGAKLVRTLDGQITVVEAATGRELFRAAGKNSVWGPAMSPDERSMVMPLEAGKDRMRLAWWDLATGKELPGAHSRPHQYPFADARQFQGTTFSPDGRFLATRVGDTIAVLDARTREVRTTLKVPNGVDAPDLDFSRDGRYIAMDMTMWSTEIGTGEGPYLHYTPDAMCNGTRFGRDGTTLRCVDEQDRVRTIDVSAFTGGIRFAELSAHSAISGDGRTLAVASSSFPGTVQVWDTATGARRGDLAVGHPLSGGTALSPDGRFLALPGEAGAIEVWDVRARTRRTTIAAGPPPLAGRPLPSFSPDGRALAVLTSTKPSVLTFFDAATGRRLGEARAAAQRSTVGDADIRIVWSKDGRRVVSATDLGVVAFPSGRTAVPPGALGAPLVSRTVQALNPQGVLATVEGVVNQRTLIFWDAATLKQRGAPVRLPEGKTPITALSPDGRLAATADSKGRIDVWDVATQRHLGLALTGHTTGTDTVIDALAFSADGTRLYSVGEDDAKLVTHLVGTRPLRAALCKQTGGLTRREWDRNVRKDYGIPYRATC
ncbi:WD40 repeat domain-containing serine/threonine protein kinase [Actinomadura parmotrematis]|uniref:Protein kinase n=1 Tax=Actinomadura parmotrematis TaxID=2864039 RepID=A0ABS7FZ03_9ACTN|nr:serine/threonine-protein kinase [Actinomadura parmotrematis]MBW8485676.1 protein kinase [Actinomadura parmotrematis]